MKFDPIEEARLDRAIEEAVLDGKLEEALQLLETVNDADKVASVVADLAYGLGDVLRAIRAGEEGAYDNAAHETVFYLSKHEDFDRAIKITRQINDGLLKSQTFGALIEGLVDDGRYEDALNCLQDVTERYIYDSALTQILLGIAEKGNPELFFDLVREIEDEEFRLTTLDNAALLFLRRGLLEPMEKALELMDDDNEEISVLSAVELGCLFARRGEFYRAITSVEDIGSHFADPLHEALLTEFAARALVKAIDEGVTVRKVEIERKVKARTIYRIHRPEEFR